MNTRRPIAVAVTGCTTTKTTPVTRERESVIKRVCQGRRRRTVIPQGDHGGGKIVSECFKGGPGPHDPKGVGDVEPEDDEDVADVRPNGE